jgi:hypothetical protein
MGVDPIACSSEWDCGVGERCVDANCVCVGCACSQAPPPSGTIEAPYEQAIPIELGARPECGSDLDCEPLGYCNGSQCIETTACVEDIDCYEDWPEEPRFCVDGLCKPIDCADNLDCPDVALCEGECKWVAVLPDCVNVPSFDALIADTLVTPDSAAVVILDLDVDGRDDLAVLDDGALHWLMSTGVGFAVPIPWPVDPGTQPIALGRADIHGDGADELLVGHVGVLGVEILVAGAAGIQSAGFVATVDAPELPTAMDVDYDGLPDLVSGTTIEGATTLIQAQLGDGTGTFASLWTDDVEPFDWIGPFPAMDWTATCGRALASGETDFLGLRRLDHQGRNGGKFLVFGQPTAGQMILGETPTHPAGIIASAPFDDRGVLYIYQSGAPDHLVQLLPMPDDVVLVSSGGQTHHAIIDHGAEMAEFVELSGSPLAPVCRGSLGFALDVEQLAVGDFDADGREDMLGRGSDGIMRVWYSRE